MSEYDIRFERLCEQYEDLLREIGKRYDRKMPRDEIRATALIGLFYADITYRSGMDYDTHVENCVVEALDGVLEKQRAAPYTVSLNQTVGDIKWGGEWLTMLRAPGRDRELKIMFDQLCEDLPGHGRVVIHEIRGKSSAADIAEDHNLSEAELRWVFRSIRESFVERYGDAI